MALPYDSDEGRDVAGAVTALMCGEAYAQSARVAERMGPFPGYAVNREADARRYSHASRLHARHQSGPRTAGSFACRAAFLGRRSDLGEKHGFKNSQVTVLAPTGTIGFMMDCDTTGIEPDLALVKYKKLVGGGLIKIVNNTVPQAMMQAWLHAGTDQRNRRLHRQARQNRRRAALETRSIFRCSIARSLPRAADVPSPGPAT